jgi:hypothetical protein
MKKPSLIRLRCGVEGCIGALAATLLSTLLGGCADPMDVAGVAEVVTESHRKEPLQDDQLSDKHPEYDAERTVLETFDGCEVTLNKSASVTRLTLQSSSALDRAVKGKIFPSRGAAQAALSGAPTLPSIEVVNGALKPFNDGLYAAVELAAERGDASLVNKQQLLLDLLAELMARSKSANAAEHGPALAGARHIATALTLAGDATSVPPSLAGDATDAATAFQAQGIYSKPIGFYTWSPQLESIFKRDRWLQKRYIPGGASDVPFDALAELGLLAGQPGPLSDAYRRSLDLYAGLTDPFFDADPFSIAPFVPNESALGDLASVERDFAATLPVDYPDFPFCNPGAAAFPASESAENRVMRRLLCGGELGDGETLLDGLIRKIQTGELDLTPRTGAGFYDQQLYALETLLVPEKAHESAHLLLTRAYKQKLVETFKSLLIQTRETHVKQVGLVDATAVSYIPPPIEFTVYPKLVVEPFPTFYLRTARAYRFLEGVLNTVLGPEFLAGTSRLLEDGSRSNLTLGAELAAKQQLLYGLHTVSADSIGMAPELAADELTRFPLDSARAAARTWLANVADDADVARDPRVSLPVALETDPSTNVDYAIYWAVVGVKVIHLQASFPESRRPEVVSAMPYGCVQTGWKTFEPYLLVEQTIQVRRRANRPPLTREEFRALCDEHDTAEAIADAFAAAP